MKKTGDITMDPLNPKCYGRRYNFKKGMELCVHRMDCKFFTENVMEVNVDFRFIKDFRKCKLYTE